MLSRPEHHSVGSTVGLLLLLVLLTHGPTKSRCVLAFIVVRIVAVVAIVGLFIRPIGGNLLLGSRAVVRAVVVAVVESCLRIVPVCGEQLAVRVVLYLLLLLLLLLNTVYDGRCNQR